MSWSIALRTAQNTLNTPHLELSPRTSSGLLVRRVTVSLVNATASVVGLGVAAAAGAQADPDVNSVLLLPTRGESAPTSPAKAAVAWVTPPTSPASFLRRDSLPAAVGAAVTWDFGADGLLLLPASGATPAQSLVVWNIAAGSVADVSVLVD